MGLAFLITTENLQLLGERKVLKEAEYATLLDAAQVIESARDEARRIVEGAAAQAEERRRAGYEEGLRQGRTEQAQGLLAAALGTEGQLRALRQSMAQIVARAVQQFLGDADPAQLMVAAMQRVEALIRHEPFVVARVAPAQEAVLRSALQRLGAEAAWAARTSIVVDASLADGACVLQTPSGSLEIGVEAQIEVFRRAVEQRGIGVAAG
jgi:type III secretion protein L